MMHVLILPTWYPSSNNHLSGIFFKEQAEALAKHNINIGCIAITEISLRYIFSIRKDSINYCESNINGVNTISILYPVIGRFEKIRKFLKLEIFKILFKKYVIKYGKPDLIHLHSSLYGDLAIWVKENFEISYVVTEHFSGFEMDTISKKDLCLAKEVFKKSYCIIAVSKQFSMLLEKKFKVQFDYIPNMVNIDYFNLKRRRNNKQFKFINIAFLKKNKNQYMLVNSFNKAFGDNKSIKLSIVGDGPEYENLVQLINALKCNDQIKLYGRANRSEIRILLQNSDAFVLSSLHEPFGVVIIEAMACGLPVVATRSGGPESIITSCKVGLLTNIIEDDLSRNLKKIYSNRHLYDPETIRQYVKDNFSENAVCLQLIKLYKQVIEVSGNHS